MKKFSFKFFKKFILEEEGQNKDKFDIKTRAIMPLVDGARLLVLSSEIRGTSIIPMLDLSPCDYRTTVYLDCAEF
jgi:CBS domain-containing protein